MASYLLDTGILVGFLRGASYAETVAAECNLWDARTVSLVSVVSDAELRSFAIRRKWGQKKLEVLNELFRRIAHVPIEQPALIEKWAEIDAFNHNKHDTLKLQGSNRKMGDNDIWIAATASVLRARLLTTDHDYDHLDGLFLDVTYVDPKGPDGGA